MASSARSSCSSSSKARNGALAGSMRRALEEIASCSTSPHT